MAGGVNQAVFCYQSSAAGPTSVMGGVTVMAGKGRCSDSPSVLFPAPLCPLLTSRPFLLEAPGDCLSPCLLWLLEKPHLRALWPFLYLHSLWSLLLSDSGPPASPLGLPVSSRVTSHVGSLQLTMAVRSLAPSQFPGGGWG